MDYLYYFRPKKIEEDISLFYKSKGFHYPHDLNEQDIAESLGVTLIYSNRPTYAYVDHDIKLINIENELPTIIRREHFFHEVCHVVRHSGSQLLMHEAFVDYQEMDSSRFIRYASLPYHMIIEYDFTDPFLIQNLSVDFNVNPALCFERMQEMKRNCFGTNHLNK